MFIALNDYSSAYDTPIIIVMTTNGEQVGDATTIESNLRDLNVNDFVSGIGQNWADGSWAAVGRAANGRDYYTPDPKSSDYSINGGTRLVVNTAATFGDGLRPTTEGINNSDWFMFGPDLTGNVRINTINTIGGQAAARTSGAGTGTDAAFNVSFRTSSPVAYVVTIATAGTNYANDDVLVITGEKLGGETPLNDLTIAITTEGGVITDVDASGSPTLVNTILSLQGNPVTFSSFENWNDTRILAQTSTDALLITLDVFDRDNVPHAVTLGNVGWDTFNAVAFSTVSNCLYVGGRYHPLGNGGAPRRSVLAKIHGNNSPLDFVWQVEVDDYKGRNEIRGIAVDSEDNIGVIAVNDYYETVVTKVNGSGVMQWQRIVKSISFGPSYDNDTYGIGVDDLNNFIITARAHRGDDFDSNNEDLVIASFGPDGDLLWSRSLGTIQNDYSQWDRTFRNITVNHDTMVITGYSYAGGFRVTHPSNSVGVVAKLPTDGTGLGHYGEWRYMNLPLEIEVVSNTAANTATMTFTQSTDIDWDNNSYTYANLAVRSGGMMGEFGLPSITYQAGGPGEITGLNELVFTNGARISNVSEEGLMLWQPSPTPAQLTSTQLHNAEYIALAYGGDNAENANVIITAGTYNWATDDDNLESIYYPDGWGQNQQQVNIDIKAEGGDADNISNWHFDENGSMYLPAQSGYYLDGASLIDPPTDYGNGKTGLAFSLADNPKLATLLQPGDLAINPSNFSKMTVVIDTRTEQGVFYANVATVWVEELGVPSVNFSNQQQNGVVFSDGSKQQTAGRKIIPGYPGERNHSRSFGTSYNLAETLIWTASSAEINAFRGTVRCQFNDTSVAMKIYDVAGASYNDANLYMDGGWDMTATPLVEIGVSVWDPVTFRLDINQGDLIMRIYATAPADATVYMTTDITEFGYTHD